MKKVILGIVAILFAVTTAVAAEQVKKDSKKADSSKKSTTTVAASTSTKAATKSVKKIKEVKKVRSNFSGNLYTGFAHYFRDTPAADDWQRLVVAPSISYSIPNTKLAVSADVTIDNRANYMPDQEIYQEIDGASVSLSGSLWSNQSGTSLSAATAYGMDFVSTVDGAWTKRTSNVFGGLYLNQQLGKFTLQFNPDGYYYFQPNKSAGDVEQIMRVAGKVSFKAHDKVTVWSKLRYERDFNYLAKDSDIGLLYLGASTGFKNISITPYWRMIANLDTGADPVGRQNYVKASTLYLDINYGF